MLEPPQFFDAALVPTLFLERVTFVEEEAAAYRKNRHVAPASEDEIRIAAFGIDPQISFCTPSASLYVPGASLDMERTLRFLYRNLDKITELSLSLDTHNVFQVFHPAWWVDADGNAPRPFTTISAADVRTGRWRPAVAEHAAEALEYVERLEASGKYVLTIWPYHALLGGVGHALVPSLAEAAMFHALTRRTPTVFETKGGHPLTENYSVLSPEVRELGGVRVGAFNTPFFERLMRFDRVYVFGQAKSHCVLSTLLDMKAEIERVDRSLLRKIYILEDATSPVPPPPLDPLPPALDFPTVAKKAFAELAEAGMKLVKTTDPIVA